MVLRGDRYAIYHGDNLELLKNFRAESIDARITDPPAGIDFMGKRWDSSMGDSAIWIEYLGDRMKAAYSMDRKRKVDKGAEMTDDEKKGVKEVIDQLPVYEQSDIGAGLNKSMPEYEKEHVLPGRKGAGWVTFYNDKPPVALRRHVVAPVPLPPERKLTTVRRAVVSTLLMVGASLIIGKFVHMLMYGGGFSIQIGAGF